MYSNIFEAASRISTHFRCDHCHIKINQTSWQQCKICKMFDLCAACAKLKYEDLSIEVRRDHETFHIDLMENKKISNDCMQSILIEEAENFSRESFNRKRDSQFQQILQTESIRNDADIWLVMCMLKKHETSLSSEDRARLNSMITKYHVEGSDRNIRVLSLDGGGIRGYMSIKVVSELIQKHHLSDLGEFNYQNKVHRDKFKEAQSTFRSKFDYFVGTSTGGLIAFCLAMNKDIYEIQDIYVDSSKYFKKNRLGPYVYAKYNPKPIHDKIDEIINSIKLPNGKQLSADAATLLDIHNLLNPTDETGNKILIFNDSYHGNLLEFVDELSYDDEFGSSNCVIREKILLINAYNTTTNSITIFNTSYAEHWHYRIADVLKATMAAPTYFPPHKVFKVEYSEGKLKKSTKSELYIDGGVFANDPELAALWAIRMQWKKLTNYHFLSIGTGCYSSSLPADALGGYADWIFKGGVLVNTMMDATRSLTEVIIGNLAKFNDMKRLKFNYNIKKPMDLDDANFISTFDKEWTYLKTGEDFKALLYFYKNYIVQANQL